MTTNPILDGTVHVEPLRELCDRLTLLHDHYDRRLNDEHVDWQLTLEHLLVWLLRLVDEYREVTS